MRPFFAILLLGLMVCLPSAKADGPDEDYANIYALVLEADTLNQKGDFHSAHAKYLEARSDLRKLQVDNPDWNVKAVKYRLDYLAAKIEETAAPANPAAQTNAAGSPTASTTPPAESGEPVEMKLKWEVGRRYELRLSLTQSSEMNLPGSPQPMKQETKQTQDVALTVLKEREGGGDELEMEILGMAMVTKAGGRDLLNFDSHKPASNDAGNPAAPMLRKMVGLRVKFLTDSAGKIEKVEGVQEALDKITAGASGMEQEMIKGMFTEDNFKEMYSAAQGLPDKPVKPGSTWPLKMDVALGPLGSVILNAHYTFKGWEMYQGIKCAVLEFAGTLSAAPEPGSTGGMAIDNGKTSGKIWFDPVMGMVVNRTTRQAMTVKITAQGHPIVTKVTAVESYKLAKMNNAKRVP